MTGAIGGSVHRRKPEKVGYSTEVSLDKALENVLFESESNERLIHEASNVFELDFMAIRTRNEQKY